MRRAVFALAGALALAGCVEWQQRPVTAPRRASAPHPVRVTLERGARRLTLERATVRADTVEGIVVEAQRMRDGRWARDDTAVSGDHVAFPLRDVWQLEERGTNAESSLVAFVMAIAVTAIALHALLSSLVRD